MRNIFATLTLGICLSTVVHALDQASECPTILSGSLDEASAFVLNASQKLYRYGQLTKPNAANREALAKLLKRQGLTTTDWDLVDNIKFDKTALGTKAFLEMLEARGRRGAELPISKKEAAVLRKLNAAAEDARSNLVNQLAKNELVAWETHKRLLTFEELNVAAQQLTQNAEFRMSHLGYADLETWRYAVTTTSERLRKKIEKDLSDALLNVVSATGEIPEGDTQLLDAIAGTLNTPSAEIVAFMGSERRLFHDMNHLISLTTSNRPGSFRKVMNRRFFSAERQAKMLEAVRNASEVILFKAAESQDLINFNSVKALSRALNDAPIVIGLPFAEIGLIPEKLHWLFKEPNVHFMVDRGIAFTRDFLVVDYGFEDKRQNPLTGLEAIHQPTDRVVLFHPRVRSITRASGNYDTHSGFIMTTGSMSDPAYWGKFNISMSTDERAQLEAEQNRSVVVLSRRYRSEKFGDLVGSANGIAPRRVRFSDARYGNSAGLFDLGKLYTDNGVFDLETLPAVVLGDVHLGNTDPKFLRATADAFLQLGILQKNPYFGQPLQRELMPGKMGLGAIVLHDLIDGGPNNRHNLESLISQAVADKNAGLSLENHVRTAAAWVKELTLLLPETQVIVPVDNHGSDWLVKRLQDGDLFRGPPKEVPLVLQLMKDAIQEGANPYKRLFQYFGLDSDRVLFMSNADTYRAGIDFEHRHAYRIVQGVEVGQHGHMGWNGAKSISVAKLLSSYGANVSGHTHSSAEVGTSVKVGTGTPVRQSYHRGPSSSDASIALVYSDMAVQLLRMQKGSFVPNAAPQPPEEFFPSPEFPKVLTRKIPPGGPTTDQYRSNPPVNRHRR